MNIHYFITLITLLLIILWAYTAIVKLANLKKFRYAMRTQVFPTWIGEIFVYLIPIVEIVLIALLLNPSTRLLGMYSSMFTLILFTLYVSGAVLRIYERFPCACGGIFSKPGWNNHLKINIMLSLIALAGAVLMEQ